MEISDPTTLEALEVQEALALADDLYEQRIYVASDCKIVIDDIKYKSAAVYGAIILEILDHSSFFTSCSFSHEFRSSNTEARNLAKHALSLGLAFMSGNPGDLTFVPVNIVTS